MNDTMNKTVSDPENKTGFEDHSGNDPAGLHFSQAFELYRNNDERVKLWCRYFLDAVGQDKRDVFLDCGCGVGRFTLPMSSFFRETYGVDLDKSMLEIARRKSSRIKWINANVTGIPLPDVTADTVLASMLIEHLDSPDSFFAELQRIVKPDGVFLLRTMLPDDIDKTTWYGFSAKARQLELDRTRSYEDICLRLSECGFDLVGDHCKLNVIEAFSGSIVKRLQAKSYEVLHRLNTEEFNELLKNAEEWENKNPANGMMSSSLLVFRKVR